MLPLSVFTLALLGGYIFVSHLHWTRYRSLRSDGYRLVFSSAIWGVVFLFTGTVISSLALEIPAGQWISDFWHRFVPPEHSGKAAVALLFGALLWIPLNWLGEKAWFGWLRYLSDSAAIDREVGKKRNPLEVILRQALKSESLVSVTVKNGKVYIGKVASTTFNPAFGMQALNLVLSRSGHRHKDTQQMILDTNYDETHSAIREELGNKLVEQMAKAREENPSASPAELWRIASREVSGQAEILNYEIVIPISEVQSVNVFDMDTYNKFFAPKQPREFVPPPTP